MSTHLDDVADESSTAKQELQEMQEEVSYLRGVYEAQRAVLRYYGVNARRYRDALLQLTDAVERVKLWDANQLEGSALDPKEGGK